MGKHCPRLCLYPAAALIHIRCLINTGNYRVARSERLIYTHSALSLSRESSVAVGVLALGCSISGSGLEQLSALIVRLMAPPLLQASATAMAGPHSQGHTGGTAPSGVEHRAISRDATVKSGERARLASSLSTLTEHDMDHIKGQVPQGHRICEPDEKVEIG